MMPTVMVSRRGAERLRGGHPWIYRSDLVSVDAAPGDLVAVATERKRPLGCAFYSGASQIALRMVAGPEGMVGRSGESLDERAFLGGRLDDAIAYRKAMAIGDTAFRLVHGEADRLPGLIVDRYGDQHGVVLVVQTLCQATDRRLPLLVELLVERLEPRGVLARNDPKVRRLEGLDESVEVAFGDVPPIVEAREGPFTFQVDVRHGQKTGLFLDQRENHAAAARYTRGRALDAFTYVGGFALAMAARAESIIAVDSSAAAVAATREHASRNGVANLEVQEANVFDALREFEIAGERFDTITLDPPAFAKNRAAVERAAAGYKEINLRAMKLLNPGGHLITCSCSYNVDEALFTAILESAAADARATMAVVERRTQARDHPVLLGVPETAYLKCFVLRKIA